MSNAHARRLYTAILQRQSIRLNSFGKALHVYSGRKAYEFSAVGPAVRSGEDQPVRLDWFWRYLRGKIGFERVRIHDLRHSFASHAAMESETLPMIGSLLGHASASSTARYAHLDDADLIDTVQSIGDLLETHLGGALCQSSGS
ncbi:tyrosine-type recombinase/integrase [Sphingomonas xinjiangensis]|uniref:tyrosine-type recombinase/integrase n=1 Tax=Sphingomonas xinjiangensis TaxID=643568 RepID=UPI0016076553|nr:tyrosine-type recombinase/integrase [Sphingomonas xinjiangensis]